MTIAVIDYGSGNLRSAAKAGERAAADIGIGDSVVVTSRPEEILAADRVVLPGQGAFADCRRGVAAVPGLEEALREAAIARGRPFLGICVGMQLMAERGLEFEIVDGFGGIAGEVVAIEPNDPTLKIPHMGWNELYPRSDHPVLAGLPAGTQVYFVHGFDLYPSDPDNVLAETDYGGPIVAAGGGDHFIGKQFYPDKGPGAGVWLLRNFLRWA